VTGESNYNDAFGSDGFYGCGEEEGREDDFAIGRPSLLN